MSRKEGEQVAQEMNTVAQDYKADKKRLKEEKNMLKEQQKQQRKEAKMRAKELAMEEAQLVDEMEGNPFSVALVTMIIVVVWLAIIALLIKLDVGGFGTNVMTPLLKNVPVVNNILPKPETTADEGGYEGIRHDSGCSGLYKGAGASAGGSAFGDFGRRYNHSAASGRD